MPEMPAFLANVLEPRFARRTQVVEVKQLAEQLKHVRFEGEALRGVPFKPGQEIEFRVSERAFRHYTPSAMDTARGTVDVVFYLHGKGPGSAWASALAVGQSANVLGPGGRFELQPVKRHVFLGDETTLGLFACMAKDAAGHVTGAVEVEAGNEHWPSMTGLSLPAVVRRGEHGEALLEWLRAHAGPEAGDTCFYLAGHTASIVRLRSELLALGWSRRQLLTKPYWADGKRGL
jgi:NADPH-dependent ferric siderophore reductase